MKKIFLVFGALVIVSISGYFLLTYGNDNGSAGFDDVEVNGVSLDRLLTGPAALDRTERMLSDGDVINLDAGRVTKKVGGNEISMYAYDGQIPGPTLMVKQGSSLTVNFKNNLDVDTTVHWHGIRVENEFDGVPGVTQKPVRPGESFVYRLVFPDTGVYWYHPHVREDFQQELGLYGNIIVEPSDPGYYNEVDAEEVLALDDIRIRNRDVDLFSDDYVNYALMGRFGNVMLVNGEEDYRLSAATGDKVRFYLTNVANTRTFNFSIEGQDMTLVGDDSGRYERDAPVGNVVIGPSERRIVEVKFKSPGSFKIIHRTPESEYVLGEVRVSGSVQAGRGEHGISPSPDIRESVADIGAYLKKSPDIEMLLKSELSGMMGRSGSSMGHMMPDGSMMGGSMTVDSGPIEWEDDMFMMNSMSNSENTRWVIRDSATGKENEDLVYKAMVGEVKKVRIFNDPSSMHSMQHPIHLHGQRFLVLSEDGLPNGNLAWKDTVLVKKGSMIDILVDFTNPGDWIIHCHIPEHMESGMMAKFEVSP